MHGRTKYLRKQLLFTVPICNSHKYCAQTRSLYQLKLLLFPSRGFHLFSCQRDAAEKQVEQGPSFKLLIMKNMSPFSTLEGNDREAIH